MKKSTDFYARQGLRTLVFAQKVFDEEEYQEWDKRFVQAEISLDLDRKDKLKALAKELEHDMEYLGVSNPSI